MVTAAARLLVSLLVAGMLLLASVGGGGALSEGPGGSVAPPEGSAQLAEQIEGDGIPETDNTITRIALHPNGTATWTLQIRTRLDTDQAAEEYRAFQDRFEANTTRYAGAFEESVTGIVDNAAAATGREMTADGVSATTSIQSVPRRWGIVTYEFRWVGFAAVDGERLRVGDVFEGGFFIAEGDRLEIVAPDGYRVESVAPAPAETGNGSVAWEGREDFADRRPQVVAVPEAPGTTDSGTAGSPLDRWLFVLAVGALLVLLVVGAYVVRKQRGAPTTDPGASTPAEPTPTEDGEAVLADEEYVRRALEANDGRMKQAALAEALDWSTSKTSRVLARMEKAGTIRKLRLGRENVIDLEDDETGE